MNIAAQIDSNLIVKPHNLSLMLFKYLLFKLIMQAWTVGSFICLLLIRLLQQKPIALVYLFFITVSAIYAEGEPLIVGVDHFNPPFVMRGANKQFYGFDISMMEMICKTIKRTCQYRPMHFKDLLVAVANKEVDVAVSSIIISAERAQKINFSLPYMLSYGRFIGPSHLAKQPFNHQALVNPKVGVEEGAVFIDLISVLSINNPTIISYKHSNDIIAALTNEKIDVALLDAPTTLYWQSQSSGLLAALGEPINYGYGLGIAVNRDDIGLLQAINNALMHYQNSPEFKRDYHKYIEY